MSDYKRLVAYIYLYNKGSRVKNIGFTKVESKNGECRIQVHVKGAWMAEGVCCRAYLFYREKRKLKGIYIGEFTPKNGTGELRTVTSAENIMDSGLDFGQMAGIVILTEGSSILATRWDDGPVSFEEFTLHGEKEEEREAVPDEDGAVSRPENTWFRKRRRDRAEEAVPERAEESAPGEEPWRETSRGEQRRGLPEREPWRETSRDGQRRGLPEGESGREALPGGDRKSVPEEETDNSQELSRTWYRNSDESRKKQKTEEWLPEQEQDVQAAEIGHEEQGFGAVPGGKGEDLWEKIKRGKEMLTPFGRNAGGEYISLEPAQLLELGALGRYLVNNSFLLHGFYNYGHILLGVRPEDREMVIGVPGEFYVQEKVMASLFGFPEFRKTVNSYGDTENMGYWLRKIEE